MEAGDHLLRPFPSTLSCPVEDSVSEDSPDPRVVGCFRFASRLIVKVNRGQRCRTREQRFRATRDSPKIHVKWRELRLSRPHFFLEPAQEWEILGVAPQNTHCYVRVIVN